MKNGFNVNKSKWQRKQTDHKMSKRKKKGGCRREKRMGPRRRLEII